MIAAISARKSTEQTGVSYNNPTELIEKGETDGDAVPTKAA
jgi:hypothetical protein